MQRSLDPCFLKKSSHDFPVAFVSLQIFTKTEVDTQVLVYSGGAVLPFPVSADMSMVDVTAELVKVRHHTASGNDVLLQSQMNWTSGTIMLLNMFVSRDCKML